MANLNQEFFNNYELVSDEELMTVNGGKARRKSSGNNNPLWHDFGDPVVSFAEGFWDSL